MRDYIYRLYHFCRSRYKSFPLSPLRALKELEKLQYANREELKSYQLSKINSLIDKAKSSTDFYGDFYTTKGSFSRLEDFIGQVPILNKEQVRSNQKKLVNYNSENRFPHATSGSTGIPIVAEISGVAQVYRLASILRFYKCWDIKENDKSVLIWGTRSTAKEDTSLLGRLRKKLRNRLDINVFDINEEKVGRIYAEIVRFSPKYIRGYPSGFYTLSKLMKERNLSFKNLNLKVAIVTGEILHTHQREIIEEVFACSVANEYGSGDGGLYAYECPEGSMHINEECVFLHTVNNNSIVTELYNDGMPLINYRNGDRVKISDDYCACGRTSRLLSSIEGRDEESIIAPDGTERNQSLLYYIIAELKDIGYANALKQVRVTQTGKKFVFEIIPEDYHPKVAEHIIKRMKEEISNDIDVSVKLVDSIERDKSGKSRMFIRN